MMKLIYSDGNEVQHQFVLEPFSGMLKAKLDSGELDLNIPRIFVEIIVESLSFGIDHQQYLSLISIMDKFSLSTKNVKVITNRPNESPQNNPEDWWKCIKNTVVKEEREKKEKMGMELFY